MKVAFNPGIRTASFSKDGIGSVHFPSSGHLAQNWFYLASLSQTTAPSGRYIKISDCNKRCFLVAHDKFMSQAYQSESA
jgi:hypothetical protein